MDLDPVDEAFVNSIIPDGAIVTGLTAVVVFLDPDDGQLKWKCYCDMEIPVSQTLGMLELAKLDVIARSDTGLPFRYDS